MKSSRRSFLSAGPAALAALELFDSPPVAAQDSGGSFFDFRSHYGYAELKNIYHPLTPVATAAAALPAPPPREMAAPAGSVLYYWDAQANRLTNPFNLKPDAGFKAGTSYMLKSSVYNFHSSKADMDSVWADESNNVQLTFQAMALDPFDQELTWIVMAGLNMASANLKGADNKSLSVTNNNQLTGSGSPSDSIIITDGQVSLTLGVAGQKKKSFWDTLVSLLGTITDSPVFGLLPLPRLASSTLTAVSGLLSQIEKANKLVRVLSGKQVDFRLYDATGSDSNPFVLKPGFWVVLNADQAKSYIDLSDGQNFNKNIVLDIPSQQYALVDTSKNNMPIDVTYAVARIQLPQYKGNS